MPKITQENVLVLNKWMMAIQVTSARSAICDLVTKKAQVVDYEYFRYDWEEWKLKSEEIHATDQKDMYPGFIKSPSTFIYVPQVIQVVDATHARSLMRAVRFSRKNVLQRDDYTCQYCGLKAHKSKLTMDHIIPKSKGGTNAWTNVVTCCKECNSKKGDKLLSQLGWQLIKKPIAPPWKAHINKSFDEVKTTYWNRFLGQENQ